ncbi:nucleic acid-binding protein [Aliterella atlantica CENA595]|uniref:Nucleic acid-binding protein n=1 Tax=Aliterella atlantica CENA595 TaxID=1618023 RepID=A0A0D9A1N4_9CYAN|nr:nucleic acid-binding protein [Aliterella atlantica CENA595]
MVVSDTSPITNLAAIGQLDLLRQLYETIVISLAVYNEMVAVSTVVPGAVEVQTLWWIQTQTVANVQSVVALQSIQDDIDLGEAEAMALALELKADLLLMDERRGRALAANYGLSVTGLLGVLLQAKRNGFIPFVKPVMDRLIEEADFRVSSQLYATVLKTAGE